MRLRFPFASLICCAARGGVHPQSPYRRVLDYVKEPRWLVYWPTPEVVAYHDLTVGPVAVRLSTDPHPSVISESFGHTGFGGVYEDGVCLIDSGGEWGASLTAYCRGERAAPTDVVGEGASHHTGQASKRLSDALTVLWVEEISRAEVFEALAKGRNDAMRQDRRASLRLQELTLASRGIEQVAWPGEEMTPLRVMAHGPEPLRVVSNPTFVR